MITIELSEHQEFFIDIVALYAKHYICEELTVVWKLVMDLVIAVMGKTSVTC